MPLVLSELYKKTSVRIESFGECELRHLSYDDRTFATKLLSRFQDGREYTARVLHHHLIVPEIAYEQFAQIPDDDLQNIARAFIANNRLSFELFHDTNDEEFFDNFRKAISAQLAELGKQLAQIANLYSTNWKTVVDSIAAATKDLPAIIDSITRSSKQLVTQYQDVFTSFCRAILRIQQNADPGLFALRNAYAKNVALHTFRIDPSFLKEFNSIAPQLALAFNPTTHVNFSRNLLEILDHAIRTEGLESDLKVAERLLQDKIDSLPKTTISLQGLNYLLLVLTFLLQCYQTHLTQDQQKDSKESGKVQIELLNQAKSQTESLNRLVDGINQIISQSLKNNLKEDLGSSYVVQRIVIVRVESKRKSVAISKLYPNQIVRLLERKHEWIYIEYFDYIDAVPRNGWVLKKYLKLLAE